MQLGKLSGTERLEGEEKKKREADKTSAERKDGKEQPYKTTPIYCLPKHILDNQCAHRIGYPTTLSCPCSQTISPSRSARSRAVLSTNLMTCTAA